MLRTCAFYKQRLSCFTIDITWHIVLWFFNGGRLPLNKPAYSDNHFFFLSLSYCQVITVNGRLRLYSHKNTYTLWKSINLNSIPSSVGWDFLYFLNSNIVEKWMNPYLNILFHRQLSGEAAPLTLIKLGKGMNPHPCGLCNYQIVLEITHAHTHTHTHTNKQTNFLSLSFSLSLFLSSSLSYISSSPHRAARTDFPIYLSRHPSLSSIASGWSSKLHPVLVQSYCR